MRLWSVALAALACALLLLARDGESSTPPLAAAQVADSDTLHILGDADCNETVNAVDALQVLRNTAGLGPVADCVGLGNVNCDSSTNAVDALGILRFTAALPPIPSDGCPAVGSASMRLLTLDKFGDGAVSALPGGLVCSDNCTAIALAAPDGSEVGLDAVPESGSRFDNWSGCDSAVGDGCSVTLDRDKTVFATFAFDEVVIPPTTKVLDDTTMALLLRVQGNTYYFDPSAAAVAELQPGDVMVAGSGEGLLRKVVAVTVDANEIAVVTGVASLEDAIEKGTVVIHQQLTPASASQANAAVAQPAAIADQINVAFDGGVGLSGSYSFHPYLDVAISFDGFEFSCLCYPVREARAVLHMDQTAELNLFAEGGVSVSHERTIWQQPLTKIPVAVGPIVLVFFPELSINAGVSVTASAGFETGVSLFTDVSAGVKYVRGSGWHGIGDLTRGSSFSPPQLTGSVEAKGYLSPEFILKLYNVIGPYVSLEGFGRLKADPTEDPWWTKSVGVGASAGFAVDVPTIGRIAEFHAVVLEAEWVLAQADSPPPTGTRAPAHTPTPTPTHTPTHTPTPTSTPASTPLNHPPNPPSPYWPEDGATISPEPWDFHLCWDDNGDPDGDVLQWRAVVVLLGGHGDEDVIELPWVDVAECYYDDELGELLSLMDNFGLSTASFAWHVVARDPSGLLSDWSPCWGNVSPVGSIPDCYGNPWWSYFTLVVGSTGPPTVLQVTQVEASSHSAAQDGCGYLPQNLFDGTGCIWATLNGDSVGAWVHITLAGQREVTMLRFRSFGAGDPNTRIQDAFLSFADGSMQSIHLQDVGEWQDINISPVTTDSIWITVNTTYPGTRYPDADILVLQEMEIWGR